MAGAVTESASAARTLAAIAAVADGTHAADDARSFKGVAALDTAGPDDITYLENRRYLEAARATRAGAVLVMPALAAELPRSAIAIAVASPALAFARVARLFHPPPPPVPGIHPTAVVAADAELGEGCEIGPLAVIGAGARLGARCIVGPHATVGAGSVLGADCRLHAHSSIEHAVAGARVVLHAGARVGNEGFGFAPTPDGRYETLPQLGRVVLGDEVEIGANACVDRGALGDTVLGTGVRLDNLVMIGHNVCIGRGGIVVAQAGISGSTRLGDHVMVAAQAGLLGHISVGNRARIGAQSGVTADVAAGADVLGSPAWPARETWRAVAQLRRLAKRGAG